MTPAPMKHFNFMMHSTMNDSFDEYGNLYDYLIEKYKLRDEEHAKDIIRKALIEIPPTPGKDDLIVKIVDRYMAAKTQATTRTQCGGKKR